MNLSFFNFIFKNVLYELSNDIQNIAFQLFPRYIIIIIIIIMILLLLFIILEKRKR